MENPPPSERRRNPRYRGNFPARIQVLVPEETFTPRMTPGTVLDFSAGGCKLRCPDVSRDQFANLIKAVRHAKMQIDLPGHADLEFRGDIVWVDYHNASVSEREFVLLGIAFSTVPDNLSDALEALALQFPSA